MAANPMLTEPGRVEEPQAVGDYAAVLSQVAREGKAVIVRRGGEDLAAVVPLDHLELLREVLAAREYERLASRVDWDRVVKENPPPQSYFEGDEPKPF